MEQHRDRVLSALRDRGHRVIAVLGGLHVSRYQLAARAAFWLSRECHLGDQVAAQIAESLNQLENFSVSKGLGDLVARHLSMRAAHVHRVGGRAHRHISGGDAARRPVTPLDSDCPGQSEFAWAVSSSLGKRLVPMRSNRCGWRNVFPGRREAPNHLTAWASHAPTLCGVGCAHRRSRQEVWVAHRCAAVLVSR